MSSRHTHVGVTHRLDTFVELMQVGLLPVSVIEMYLMNSAVKGRWVVRHLL